MMNRMRIRVREFRVRAAASIQYATTRSVAAASWCEPPGVKDETSTEIGGCSTTTSRCSRGSNETNISLWPR